MKMCHFCTQNGSICPYDNIFQKPFDKPCSFDSCLSTFQKYSFRHIQPYWWHVIITLNMIECARIHLKKQCWICQSSECVWCSTQHKVTVKEQLSRQMYSGHCQTFKLEYIICLNMDQHCCMSLNMPENAWISCFDYVRVLYML